MTSRISTFLLGLLCLYPAPGHANCWIIDSVSCRNYFTMELCMQNSCIDYPFYGYYCPDSILEHYVTDELVDMPNDIAGQHDQARGTQDFIGNSSYTVCVRVRECDYQTRCLAIDLYTCRPTSTLSYTIGFNGLDQHGDHCDP